jgi:hypothetical protein
LFKEPVTNDLPSDLLLRVYDEYLPGQQRNDA